MLVKLEHLFVLFVPNARTLNVQISKDHVAIIFPSFVPTSLPADFALVPVYLES